MLTSPEELQLVSVCEFWKGQPDFICIFNGKDTSTVNLFRYNQVFLLAGNDVKVFSPLEGAAGEV